MKARLFYSGSLFVLFLFLTCFHACIKAPSYSIVPAITFDTLIGPSPVHETSDSLIIRFDYTDGDGDIGNNTNDTSSNYFLTDYRMNISSGTWQPVYTYANKIPYVEAKGNIKSISGHVDLRRSGFVCRPGHSGGSDSLYYSIYIKDRAGHASNIIRTPVIHLYGCQ